MKKYGKPILDLETLERAIRDMALTLKDDDDYAELFSTSANKTGNAESVDSRQNQTKDDGT